MTEFVGTFIDINQWNERASSRASAGMTPVIDVSTGEAIASIGLANATDVAAAAAAAKAAQPGWAALLASDRAKVLYKAADLFEQYQDELIPWIMRESGSVQTKAAMEIEHAAEFLRHAAGIAIEPNGLMLPSMDTGRSNIAKRVPYGVVGVISPFNFPLVLSIRAIAAALATGNAVVHKPDPRTAISGGVIIARVLEAASLPPGVFQVLPGGAEAGEALCADPNIAMISFTGSTAAGSRVGEAAGRSLKKVHLELGGKNPLIILEDADLDVAASNAAWGAFLHQGQICMSTGLILVQAKISDQITERLRAKTEQLPVGDPMSGRVALGPIINDSQVTRIQGIVDDAVSKGATLVSGGTHDGRFYAATVLTGVRPGMRAFNEEIFGPVACVIPFESDDEAIELANMTEYGLAAGVISASVERARAIGDRLVVGHLHINDQTVNAGPYAPFGGRGRSGNGGRISGPAIWEEFTQWVWISVKEHAVAYPF